MGKLGVKTPVLIKEVWKVKDQGVISCEPRTTRGNSCPAGTSGGRAYGEGAPNDLSENI